MPSWWGWAARTGHVLRRELPGGHQEGLERLQGQGQEVLGGVRALGEHMCSTASPGIGLQWGSGAGRFLHSLQLGKGLGAQSHTLMGPTVQTQDNL